ncbi:hypothetical protein MSG28_015614 [Choristoneura fumiferana]|uniref:Uncharacterized protein n=2 Tax=Choristoneura fumiferana TaxID=7141 RepID=A0ACC0KAT9_CHOFU|nr:hypothetical protein MSG28_015614 [Choristoneura fumiferana]
MDSLREDADQYADVDGGDMQDNGKEKQIIYPDTPGGRKKRLCMFTKVREYCLHQEKSLK